jgi:hypothetical protein
MNKIEELETQADPSQSQSLKLKSVACFLVTVTIKKLHGVMRKNAAILTHQLPTLAVINGAYNDLVLRHTGTILAI